MTAAVKEQDAGCRVDSDEDAAIVAFHKSITRDNVWEEGKSYPHFEAHLVPRS